MSPHRPAPIDTRPEPTTNDRWRRLAARAVHPSIPSPDGNALAAIAAGFASVTVPWVWPAGEPPAERLFQMILATQAYEVWVIYWPGGTGLESHDHGDSAGAVCVVAGALQELVPASNSPDVRTTHLGPGDLVAFGPGHVHAVANRQTQPATSVHVYAPPLRAMTFYDRAADGMLVPRRADRMVTASEAHR